MNAYDDMMFSAMLASSTWRDCYKEVKLEEEKKNMDDLSKIKELAEESHKGWLYLNKFKKLREEQYMKFLKEQQKLKESSEKFEEVMKSIEKK